MILSLSETIAPINTSTKSVVDIFFAIGSNDIAALDINFLNNIPITTGTVTIKNIFVAILVSESSCVILLSSNKFDEVKTIKGIVMTQSKLIIAVNDIERATSPFANEVKIFDVAPPGAAAIIITPTANSGEIGHILIRTKATIGRIIICDKAPTKKSRGCLQTLKKSFPVRPNPKANIIKAKAKGKNTFVTIPIFLNYNIILLFTNK